MDKKFVTEKNSSSSKNVIQLDDKIRDSIELIKKAEVLSLKMQPEQGFYVGFSGGKDSQALLELVKMSGVKFRAVYSVTTNDPAENIRFIRKNYPDVEFSHVESSIMRMIEKKGLPTRVHRWCCSIFKEQAGASSVVLTGIRWEESRTRAEYSAVEKKGKTKKDKVVLDLDKMRTNEFRCVGGKDKIMVYPILAWTENDVWEFLKIRGLKINPCYNRGMRVGCAFCPFSRKGEIEKYAASHPKQKEALLHAIDRYLNRNQGSSKFKNATEVFNWWISKKSVNEYLQMQCQLSIEYEK